MRATHVFPLQPGENYRVMSPIKNVDISHSCCLTVKGDIYNPYPSESSTAGPGLAHCARRVDSSGSCLIYSFATYVIVIPLYAWTGLTGGSAKSTLYRSTRYLSKTIEDGTLKGPNRRNAETTVVTNVSYWGQRDRPCKFSSSLEGVKHVQVWNTPLGNNLEHLIILADTPVSVRDRTEWFSRYRNRFRDQLSETNPGSFPCRGPLPASASRILKFMFG